MQCPFFKIDTTIERSYTRVEGDESPDTPTRVFTVQEMYCRNPRCSHNGWKVGEQSHQIYGE